MSEVGIDLSTAQPQLLTVELAEGASLLVTMGCGDDCPFVPGARVDDWPLRDPASQDLATVRAIREEIRRRVAALVEDEGWGHP
jgi:arsenate reductase